MMKLDEATAIKVANDKTIANCLLPDPDPWDVTFLKGYVNKNNKVKGKIGEIYVERMMLYLGHLVAPAINKGHDRIINGTLTEIKFGAAHRNPKNKGITMTDVFSFNHFSVSKDWQRAILVGMNIDCQPYVVWFFKDNFINEVSKSNADRKYFNRQQAGKNGGNDDWLFMTDPNSWQEFMNEPWVRPISEW